MTKVFEDKIKAQKNEKKRQGSRYINTDFVLASTVIVERLWSKADAILCQRRKNLNPVVVEWDGIGNVFPYKMTRKKCHKRLKLVMLMSHGTKGKIMAA